MSFLLIKRFFDHFDNKLIHLILGLHNVAAACAILIVLLLCACTLVGVTVGILKGVVLATMTIGIIYLVASEFQLMSNPSDDLSFSLVQRVSASNYVHNIEKRTKTIELFCFRRFDRSILRCKNN